MSGIEYKETLTIHFIKKDGQVQDVEYDRYDINGC